jgi:hypothetical protein
MQPASAGRLSSVGCVECSINEGLFVSLWEKKRLPLGDSSRVEESHTEAAKKSIKFFASSRLCVRIAFVKMI